ncbi:SDR family NAD(P)-dependent oxidoreductase [Anaerococcus vaginalis]|uniref:SDR family NAD(P)-dependent oxidoreductase n=1 Tax=Anaerococcus vaginalis TaxID=33037 RepID=UPI002906D41A|nr:SDR family NAD(P)-dependent oxidoreductase [Anaerococcus vaginalis]MDU5252339.1 SDR family NAD(P)-dependent oxidoreductase [Anaerococcus vaginalis]MDU6781545.1 SDR family NAD(P)-dependent oxidoreductase [Anaerococcus vaginalis]
MIAIITGASSGIGYEFARQIDKKNYEEIWLIARRTERLHDLSEKLQTRARIFALDLCEEKSFEILKNELESSNKKIGLLINSAGMGENDYFKNTSFDNDMKTLDLNIKALTAMTKISLDFFQKDGIILNIASSAAFIPQAKFALYAASKSYVLSFSRAVRREFKDIKISVLCPNRVETEFLKKSNNNSSGIKNLGNENLEKMVGKAIRKMGKKDLITTHPSAKILLIISKIFPHSFIMWIEKKLSMY